jgi:hypothetical protein
VVGPVLLVKQQQPQPQLQGEQGSRPRQLETLVRSRRRVLQQRRQLWGLSGIHTAAACCVSSRPW